MILPLNKKAHLAYKLQINRERTQQFITIKLQGQLLYGWVLT